MPRSCAPASPEPDGAPAAVLLGRCLAASEGCGATLRELRLWGNRVGPGGARGLGEGLRRNAVLEVLDLAHNPVAAAGAACLAMALLFNWRLGRLNLDSCGVQVPAGPVACRRYGTREAVESTDTELEKL